MLEYPTEPRRRPVTAAKIVVRVIPQHFAWPVYPLHNGSSCRAICDVIVPARSRSVGYYQKPFRSSAGNLGKHPRRHVTSVKYDKCNWRRHRQTEPFQRKSRWEILSVLYLSNEQWTITVFILSSANNIIYTCLFTAEMKIGINTEFHHSKHLQ